MGKGLRITRKLGESVFIGEDITVTIDSLGGGQVGLRITAPADIGVHRDAYRVEKSSVIPIAASIKKPKGR